MMYRRRKSLALFRVLHKIMSRTQTRGVLRPFYITTTLPYVNAPLHLGHAAEIIRADAIARHKKLSSFDVFFNTGTDEHGLKIYEVAQKAGKNVQRLVDDYFVLYQETLARFGVLDDVHYIRTTEPRHIAAAQEFWKRCDKRGFIYKKNYQAKYCIGCEEEKTDSGLIDGKCPIHNRVPELINEENYFFKLSAFGDRLTALYDSGEFHIVPAYRLNELREFIKRGLRDFSISRLKSKMPWGIPVPGDDLQVMYVWFDALVNYLSALGWPDEKGDFKKYWTNGTPTQYCGKDNLRFQGIMWQAMLMAAGLPPTNTIVVDGFITGEEGAKMSKTLGNIIDPLEIVREYGTDALRYFVLREFHPFEDTAVSKEKLKEWYNANLANGIGNLVSRVMKLSEKYEVVTLKYNVKIEPHIEQSMNTFNLKDAMDFIWQKIQSADRKMAGEEPYKVIKDNPIVGKAIIQELVQVVHEVGILLESSMPETSKVIQNLVKENKAPATPLFPRKE